jgi:hypothetical protein
MHTVEYDDSDRRAYIMSEKPWRFEEDNVLGI